MIVNFEIPEVNSPSVANSGYWLRYIFVERPSQNYQVNALASTYMRLVEAAVVEYGLGASAFRQVWRDHTSIRLDAMHRAISHFETCITNMHRAIITYRCLRGHKARDPLSAYLANQKPTFRSGAVANQVRDIRDAIHHLENFVIGGEISEGQYFAIRPDGPEVPHASQSGQTIKTFNHLVIGPLQITFADMAAWLEEMSNVASWIAQYDPSKTQNPE